MVSMADQIGAAMARPQPGRSQLTSVSSSGGKLTFLVGLSCEGNAVETLALPLLETIVELRIGLLFDVYTPDQSEALQDQHEVAKQE
jgi:hypothetical protein